MGRKKVPAPRRARQPLCRVPVADNKRELARRGAAERARIVTYCLGIITQQGLVMASDSRSNAGHDQMNVCRKMHTFERPGERVFVILGSGSLSLTQSILTLLKQDFD